jgi:hypothetical protein
MTEEQVAGSLSRWERGATGRAAALEWNAIDFPSTERSAGNGFPTCAVPRNRRAGRVGCPRWRWPEAWRRARFEREEAANVCGCLLRAEKMQPRRGWAAVPDVAVPGAHEAAHDPAQLEVLALADFGLRYCTTRKVARGAPMAVPSKRVRQRASGFGDVLRDVARDGAVRVEPINTETVAVMSAASCSCGSVPSGAHSCSCGVVAPDDEVPMGSAALLCLEAP